MFNLYATRRLIPVLLVLSIGAPALGQFSPPLSTPVRERVTGSIRLAEGETPPEIGDQIGVFDGETLVGLQTLTSETGTEEFSVLVFGDDPQTNTVEGARRNNVLRVRFYDSGTETIRTDVRFENAAGEAATYRYRGEEIPPLPIELPGLDLTPTRALNIRIGVSDGGGGGDGGGDPTNKYDINGDGRVDTRDAALVLRAMISPGSSLSDEELSRADVNGDGRVTTADAIEILRNQS